MIIKVAKNNSHCLIKWISSNTFNRRIHMIVDSWLLDYLTRYSYNKLEHNWQFGTHQSDPRLPRRLDWNPNKLDPILPKTWTKPTRLNPKPEYARPASTRNPNKPDPIQPKTHFNPTHFNPRPASTRPDSTRNPNKPDPLQPETRNNPNFILTRLDPTRPNPTRGHNLPDIDPTHTWPDPNGQNPNPTRLAQLPALVLASVIGFDATYD